MPFTTFGIPLDGVNEDGSPKTPLQSSFILAKNYTVGERTKIDLIVVHTTENKDRPGMARDVALWFASKDAPVASAHYVVDNLEIIQCVREKDIAWHAPGANSQGLGIEHVGMASATEVDWSDEYSESMLRLAATLVAQLCVRYDIPVEKLSTVDLIAGKRGICGHVDVTNAFNHGKGHTDPGPNFPWPHYLDLISQEAELSKAALTMLDLTEEGKANT